MNEDIKTTIIKKLTKTQLFILCILGMIGFMMVILILCLLSPTSLAAFFNIF